MTDFAAAVVDLERRADVTEDGAAWTSLEHELAHLRRSVFESMVEARRRAEAIETEADALGLAQRLNPFDTKRKDHARAVRDARAKHEHLANLADRLAQLAVRFWSDRSQPFLRDLVRRAEKVQKGVPGGWSTKAAAVAGALYRGLDGDAAIERAREILTSRLAEDPRVLLAAFVGVRTVDAAERFLATAKKDPALAAAWMLSDRTEDEGVDLIRTFDASPPLQTAALLSNRTKEDIDAIRFKLDDRVEVVVAAALVCGRPLDEIRSNLTAHLALEDDVAAFALLSDRDEDPGDVARAVRAVIRASPDAERTICAAALASDLPMARCVAIIDGLQQRLTGSWSSEATIIAAALLRSDDVADSWVVHLHTP